MKKKIQKPFSIEAWKNGAKVETRDGRSVRILCTDIKSEYSIVAATMCEDGEEVISGYDANGHFCIGSEDNCDLVIVEKVEEPEPWADDKRVIGEGWVISQAGEAGTYYVKNMSLNECSNYDVFATEKQAKSALAMARISQLIAHDERYGGVVTDEEWKSAKIDKFGIHKYAGDLCCTTVQFSYYFLAFHTKEQRDLFLTENERLVKDYLMID